jgi:hypothetical protein
MSPPSAAYHNRLDSRRCESKSHSKQEDCGKGTMSAHATVNQPGVRKSYRDAAWPYTDSPARRTSFRPRRTILNVLPSPSSLSSSIPPPCTPTVQRADAEPKPRHRRLRGRELGRCDRRLEDRLVVCVGDPGPCRSPPHRRPGAVGERRFERGTAWTMLHPHTTPKT